METLDQKSPSRSGNDGQVYFCHKCGWPFPKPHPSSRHRRAHKRVCGTLDGYRLDNNSQLDVSDDGEHISDDANKTPCIKVVGSTISRKSSSGIGSQSTRSEDDVFSDAVTHFGDSPGLGEMSYGAISRGNSLLNVAQFNLESPQMIEKNVDGDKELPADNSVTLEGDVNEMKAMPSHDHISNNLYGSCMEEHKIEALSKETAEDVSEVSLYPVTFGESVEVRGNETTEVKDVVERSHDVNNPRDFQVVEPAYENDGEVPDVFKECNSITEVNEGVNVVAITDAMCLQENPDIAVEISDHKGGNFNIPMDSDAMLNVESVEFGKSNAAEDSYTSAGFAKLDESNYVSFVGDAPKTFDSVEDAVDPELGPDKSMVEQHSVGQEVQISDVRASDSDIIELGSKGVLEDIEKECGKDQEVSSCTEQILTVSRENLSSEDEASYGGDDQEMTAKEDVNTSEDFKRGDDHFFNVSAGELAVTSCTSAESFELTTIDHDRNEVRYFEKVKIHDAASNGSISGNGDNNDEFFVLENEYDKGELSDNDLVSENDTVGQILSPSLGGVGESQALGDDTQEAQSKTGENTCDVEKSGECIESILKTSEDDIVINRGVKRAADDVPGVTEDDKITKKQTVSVPNTSESSSQSQSVEGNLGSVSVVCAISDASPVTEMASSKNLQALSEEATVSSEPKVGDDGLQNSENKTPVESQSHSPVADDTFETQAQQNEQDQTSGGDDSHIVSHDRIEGQKEREIIDEVNGWENGKQHTALKTLLGEAIAISRAESPTHHDNDSVAVSKVNQVPHINNDVSSQTENASLVLKDSKMESGKEEIGEEWNSPARYPVNIKAEKKRSKNRSYWVPFLCCSSANAR